MATGAYMATDDPSQQDWQDQIRRQILDQQTADPQMDPTPAAEPSTTSPDFAAVESPTDATSSSAAPAWNAPTDQPSAAGVGAPGNASNAIQGMYAKFLGRNANDQELQSHLGNPGGIGAVENLIANSPEALAYAKAHGFGQPNAAATTTPSPTTGAYGLTNGYASMPAAGDPNQAWKDSIRQIIIGRLRADQGPVNENAPEIQAALTASRDAYSRQNTQERDALAERLYAQGGTNTDAITQHIQQSNERTGTAQSSLRAQLLMSAYKDKFTELNHLLDLATQTGDADSARQIQVTLANLQAAVAREGLGVNLAEFQAQLDQNAVLAGQN